MDPHRMSLFSKMHDHQIENSQKPRFLTPPQPRHSDKLSAASIFSNGLQRPFAPIRNSALTENVIPRDLDNSGLHTSVFKPASRGDSRAPPGSPSSQHSSSFCDKKGESLRVRDAHLYVGFITYGSHRCSIPRWRLKMTMVTICTWFVINWRHLTDKDRNKQFTLLGNQSFQHSPVDHSQSSLNAKENFCSQSSIGLLENDMSEEDLILSKMASNHRQVKIELVKLVGGPMSIYSKDSWIIF